MYACTANTTALFVEKLAAATTRSIAPAVGQNQEGMPPSAPLSLNAPRRQPVQYSEAQYGMQEKGSGFANANGKVKRVQCVE
mmetsp:Transcript_1585/g.3402  ORF Transcript_1585/g.3402 Transcript_1585/m.3402 type:complete len:82 (+) Transcript_1585:658-903(+)